MRLLFMRRFGVGLLFVMNFAVNLLAQDDKAIPGIPGEHHIAMELPDSGKLKDSFLKAHWEAHSRVFAMSTFNDGALKDDFALAAGAGIGMQTQSFRGFQIGLSGFFIYNMYSSDIGARDTLTNALNRYELGLFDVENPDNRNDLDRLEELYLKYSYSGSSVVVGKMNISTPFFNPQDGRMRPTMEEGVWFSIAESEKVGFSGGWIWEVSPRSTIRWFKVAESIGVNPSGVRTNGSKSQYAGNLASDGMFIANLSLRPAKGLTINAWNGFLENIMNTALIELTLSKKVEATMVPFSGVMYVNQRAVKDGGNGDHQLSYIDRGAQSNIISAQIGMRDRKTELSLNATHITGDGRYLMPREWGRDPFYTFLPRERNEGLGGVNAIVLKASRKSKLHGLKSGLAVGYYELPDVRNYRLNKYGMPSYYQINADLAYQFQGYLEGLSLRFLAAAKFNAGNTYDLLQYVYNKVDMVNLNLVVDFKI